MNSDELERCSKIIPQLMDMIDTSRAGDDIYVEAIGKALYNSTGGEDEGLDIWIKFCENDDFYDSDDCYDRWDSFDKNNNLTIKTLAHYARKDSPEKYKEWSKDRCYKAFMKCLDDQSHLQIAKFLYERYWLDFICVSVSKRIWYEHINHRLSKSDLGKCIRDKLDKIVEYVERKRTKLSQDASCEADKEKKNKLENLINKCTLLRKKLSNSCERDKIIKEASYKFRPIDDRIADKLDSDTNTIGIKNGVLEVLNGNINFRDGKLEDYITKTTGIAYRKERYSKKYMSLLDDWLKKCFVTESLMNNFMCICCSFLEGGNKHKILPFFVGKRGDNSKSMMKKLIEKTFGVYCINLPTSVFSGKKSGGPSPELAQGKGARVAFVQETKGDQKFDSDLVKALSGGDSYFARMNRENGGTINTSFTIVTLCNQMPKMQLDRAMQQRVKAVPFDSIWVSKEYPETEEERFTKRIFKADPYFEDKIDGMAPVFLRKLIDFYPIYCKIGMQDSNEVYNASSEYWNKNNIYKRFFNANVTKTDDPKCYIGLDQLYNVYKNWHENEEAGRRPKGKLEFEREITYLMGEHKDGYYIGFNLIG